MDTVRLRRTTDAATPSIGGAAQRPGVHRWFMGAHRWFMASHLAIVAFVATACAAGDAREIAFTPARPLSVATPVGAAPMLAVAADGARAAAWVSAPDGGTDGRLYVRVDSAPVAEIADTLGPIEPHGEAPPKLAWAPDGALHALYVVARVVPGRRFPQSALRIVRSADRGATWGAPVTVTDDSVFGSHNFHALHAGRDGTVYVSWLDGRAGRSAAFMTHSTDGGRNWAPNVRVAQDQACPCCRTAIATAPDGSVYLAWRSVFPGNARDVVVARSADQGATWGAPVRVHADRWVYDGCPHAGPSLQVDRAGTVHVAWWTGKAGGAGVWYAQSRDGARTFAAPVALGVAEFSRPAHVQLALARDGRVVAAWDDGTVKLPRVVLRQSRDGGRTFAAAQVLSDPAVAATFPVLAATPTGLTVAWSEQGAAAHAHAEHAKPDMRDPKAVKGLTAVGASRVVVREEAP